MGLPTLAALSIATIHHSPRHLKVYFVAQLLNLGIGIAYGRAEQLGLDWSLLYVIGTACILGAMAEILYDSGLRRLSSLIAPLILAGVTTDIIVAGMRSFTTGSYITLGEGAILTFAAFALAFRSMYLERKLVYVTLTILWLSLAFFDFAYSLNIPLTDSLQYWLPATLIGVSMLIIGWRLNDDRSEAR